MKSLGIYTKEERVAGAFKAVDRKDLVLPAAKELAYPRQTFAYWLWTDYIAAFNSGIYA